MSKIIEFFQSPHIQIALATGISILVLAYFSKRVFTEPVGYLPLAAPPFVATIFESVYAKHKESKICTPWYWVIAIFLATALVITFSWN